MQRRTFVMSGLGPLFVAACGGGGEDAPALADEQEATVLDADDAASERGGRAIRFLEPVNGTESTGISVNNRGQVAGFTSAGETADFGTTLWSRGRAVRFPTLGGFGSGSPRCINDAGKIVGNSTLSVIASHATLWTGGRPVDLGTLNDATASGATCINNAGQIVGWSYLGPGPVGTTHALLWSGGRMIDLGTLPGGSLSRASGINDAGTIVGSSSAGDGSGTHAVLWRDGAVVRLNGLGGTSNHAYAINDVGLIVGQCDPPNSQTSSRAVMWRGGRMAVLDSRGGDRAVARDVNNFGQIVGSSSVGGHPEGHAMLWTGKTAIDLNDLLDAASRNAGWYLADASGISDIGWVTGTAFNTITGARRAFLLLANRWVG